ncbi:hypothetical protein Goshw_007604 [Gossypium schwendimanii]|uniref:PGG domain-containing protein n=1 Tax=Gossypium schwendimanii TaxID=34291 RepID=A0A7J9MH34_GOSSC|nr:hypothetical protein [Gossypium schwendimanii]
MDNISADDRNALLVILGLLLTATYQATLSPPGGVRQGENTSKSKGSYDATVLGKSVMDPSNFLLFYIPTYLVFLVTLFLTLALLKTFPRDFRSALQVLLAFLAVSFDESISDLAPTTSTYTILNIFSGILFLLMVYMYHTAAIVSFHFLSSYCSLILPPDMDESLRTAAPTGNVCDLYRSIERDGNALRWILSTLLYTLPRNKDAFVEDKKSGILKVLIQTIRKEDYYREVVNQKNEDGNIALHLAAFHNQPKVCKLPTVTVERQKLKYDVWDHTNV